MNLNKLKTQLKIAVPDELYKIEPGQVVLFIPKEGISQRISLVVSALFQYFRRLNQDNNLTLNFIPTDNELLIDCFAYRKPQEVGSVYEIVISTWNTIAGFAAEYYGEDINDIVNRVPKAPFSGHLSISATELPVIVSLSPNNSSATEQENSVGSFDPFDMELKQVKPEKGSNEEKALTSKLERKLEKVLRDCVIYDIELDIDRLRKKVKDSLKSSTQYKLTLDITAFKEKHLSFCTVCDIYVAKGENYKLELTAVEKTIYITFLLYEDGIRIAETFDEFRKISQKIYNQLPDDDKCKKSANGILDKNNVDPIVYTDTLRGYISKIRDEVSSKIANPLVAQDFAIEGFKDSEFGIAKSTTEIRTQIRQVFEL